MGRGRATDGLYRNVQGGEGGGILDEVGPLDVISFMIPCSA